MIGDILQPTHLLFVLVVALLVLGPKRLPEAGRALGKGIRDFRMAIGGDEDRSSSIPTEVAPAPPPEAMVPPAAAPPVETTPTLTDTTPVPSGTTRTRADGVESAEAPTHADEQPAETVHPVG
jgi:sec-independent protein translocase protein TatA